MHDSVELYSTVVKLGVVGLGFKPFLCYLQDGVVAGMPVAHEGCIFTYGVARKHPLQEASRTAADLQQVRGKACIQMYDTARDVWTTKVGACSPQQVACLLNRGQETTCNSTMHMWST